VYFNSYIPCAELAHTSIPIRCYVLRVSCVQQFQNLDDTNDTDDRSHQRSRPREYAAAMECIAVGPLVLHLTARTGTGRIIRIIRAMILPPSPSLLPSVICKAAHPTIRVVGFQLRTGGSAEYFGEGLQRMGTPETLMPTTKHLRQDLKFG